MSTKITVIGVGNPYRNDDGAGITVCRNLKKSLPEFTGKLEIIEQSGEGTALIELWQTKEFVILIDAVSSGANTGKIFKIDALKEKIPQDFFNYSTHAFSVAEAVELSKVLNTLPKKLIIFGIEGQDFSSGEILSPEVLQGIEQVITKIIDIYREN